MDKTSWAYSRCSAGMKDAFLPYSVFISLARAKCYKYKYK